MCSTELKRGKQQVDLACNSFNNLTFSQLHWDTCVTNHKVSTWWSETTSMLSWHNLTFSLSQWENVMILIPAHWSLNISVTNSLRAWLQGNLFQSFKKEWYPRLSSIWRDCSGACRGPWRSHWDTTQRETHLTWGQLRGGHRCRPLSAALRKGPLCQAPWVPQRGWF